ncbi:hypothetical protein TNCT_357051 [Trichonephila clavata]|uniref:Uncharacterized protein n=1 Tax=Trichonephila clavata TaxID=2740835 RepID=A0A8X6LAE4_TRICU|nr:hypothetical protein TNCT_357051 [Trichonephila clavata]
MTSAQLMVPAADTLRPPASSYREAPPGGCRALGTRQTSALAIAEKHYSFIHMGALSQYVTLTGRHGPRVDQKLLTRAELSRANTGGNP